MIATIARSEVTEWYPADVKPVHVGVYETRIFIGEPPTFQEWLGDCWGVGEISPDACMERLFETIPSFYQEVEWRGLRSPA